MFKLLGANLILALSLFSTQTFATSIDIVNDKNDCVDGWISMDVTAIVDGEGFNFDPSCNFSFDKSFETSKGLKCEAQASMCSAFSPRLKFVVECNDGSSEEVSILCPND